MTFDLHHWETLESPIGRWDPRWKLSAIMGAAVAVTLLQTWAAALAALVAALVLTALSRLPARWFLVRVLTLSLVLLFFVIWLPFFHNGGPRWPIGPVTISQEGVALALRVFLKALTIMVLMLVLWTTAPMDVTLKAAQALRVPGLVIHLVLLTYRYLFLLAEELGRLRIALRVRGYRHRATLRAYRTIGHVGGMLLVRGYERAERVSHAMRCRGFDGRFRSLADFQTRAGDVALFLVVLGSFAAIAYWSLEP